MDISFADILGMLAITAFISSTFFRYFKRTEEDEVSNPVVAEWHNESLANAFSYAKNYQPQPKPNNHCLYCGTRYNSLDHSCKKCGAPID